MSATSPQASEPGAADPSMDDILASIRRILNEDEPAKAEPDGASAPQAKAQDDVLVLDSSMMVPPPVAAPQPAPQPAQPPPAQPPPAPPPALPPLAALPVPAPEPPGQLPVEPGLVAPAAAAAAASSVGTLLRTLATDRRTAVHRNGPTIEDLVRDEIRPLLKEWLDHHLPPLVERLVKAEIERVTSQMAP